MIKSDTSLLLDMIMQLRQQKPNFSTKVSAAYTEICVVLAVAPCLKTQRYLLTNYIIKMQKSYLIKQSPLYSAETTIFRSPFLQSSKRLYAYTTGSPSYLTLYHCGNPGTRDMTKPLYTPSMNLC